MTDKQENFFSMCLRVEARLDNNLPIVTTIAALNTARTSFKNQLANIRSLDLVATRVVTGATEDKKAVQQSLINSCVQFSSAICAFAASTSNNTLYQEIYKSPSAIEELRDDQLPTYANIILLRLNEYIPSLSDYGITPSSISAFENLISVYSTATATPRSAIATRKTAVQQLKVQFTETNKFLRKVLDKLMKSIENDQPTLVSQYFNDRIIYDDGGPSNTIQVYEGTLTPSQTSVVGAIPASTKDVRLEVLTSGTIEFGFTDNGVDFQGNTSTINGIGSSTPAITYFGTISAATQFMARNQNAINSVQYKVTFLR